MSQNPPPARPVAFSRLLRIAPLGCFVVALVIALGAIKGGDAFDFLVGGLISYTASTLVP